MDADWTWQPPPPPEHRRRWPYVIGFLGAIAAAFLGVAGGAAHSVGDAANDAAQRRAHGDFGGAAALYLQIAKRATPLYVFARGAVSAAPLEEQKTLLAWARSLAVKGQLDQALRLAQGVTDPSLRRIAEDERASLLLEAAKSAAGRGEYGAALLRLRELQRIEPAAPVAAQASALLASYEVGEARTLVAGGHGADAVILLDAATADLGGADKAAVVAVMPGALLAAGREQIAALSFKEAAATLQRLITSYGNTGEARTARSLLSGRQPVSGTLTDKRGAAISGQVRLSSNFQNLGGGYVTSGPFFYSSANANGDFFIDAVPQGGPYVLEVFHNGDWTTLIDPVSGKPADPVNVRPLEPVDLTFIVLPS